jgi:hypothetical protein
MRIFKSGRTELLMEYEFTNNEKLVQASKMDTEEPLSSLKVILAWGSVGWTCAVDVVVVQEIITLK